MAEVARQMNVDYHTLQRRRRNNKRAEGLSRRQGRREVPRPPPKLGRRGDATLAMVEAELKSGRGNRLRHLTRCPRFRRAHCPPNCLLNPVCTTLQ